ncbi:hypothetical protein A2164_04025 [Candidatus Curtissbacteria bacterium RBG_13_35_7]|uniref:Polymerase beta nucleotidyltransferase domain-containing protein n=1 Tax=Candidatus Curtissbacteria bacterium RBG_13_35_7 TaxID=1797705 RepID=A0A1F5G651_9BACT|nr:MAG: hypothetical protein A2164_04025 [Candidatus Curtissbacteria bacterium RBG_13_35_7]
MRAKFYAEDKLKKEIIDIVGKYLNLGKYNVFFFGSRVNNRGSERSDIDVGIEGPRPIPPRIYSDIKDEIDKIPILYSIDVVDFKKVSPDFYKVATRNRQLIINR